MAKGRIIDKRISLSERVADLPLGGQLLYTWMIPHTDDFGFLQGTPRTLKAQIIPLVDCTLEEVKSWLKQMVDTKLIRHVSYVGHFYYVIESDVQRLRKDIQPFTILPIKLKRKAEDSWKVCEEIVNTIITGTSRNADVTQRRRGVTDPTTEVKLSKVKLSTVSNKKNGIKYLPDIVVDDLEKDYIAKEIIKALGDDGSKAFYKLVAAKIPESFIREALSEIKVDGAIKPAAVFTDRMKKYAQSHL